MLTEITSRRFNRIPGGWHGKPPTERQPRKEEAKSRQEQKEKCSAGHIVCRRPKSGTTGLWSGRKEDAVIHPGCSVQGGRTQGDATPSHASMRERVSNNGI